jgi:hypothetical protein
MYIVWQQQDRPCSLSSHTLPAGPGSSCCADVLCIICPGVPLAFCLPQQRHPPTSAWRRRMPRLAVSSRTHTPAVPAHMFAAPLCVCVVTWGSGIPLAGHTQFTQANPTAGRLRPCLTSETRVCCPIHLQAKELQEPEAVDGLAGGGFGKKVRVLQCVSSSSNSSYLNNSSSTVQKAE